MSTIRKAVVWSVFRLSIMDIVIGPKPVDIRRFIAGVS